MLTNVTQTHSLWCGNHIERNGNHSCEQWQWH